MKRGTGFVRSLFFYTGLRSRYFSLDDLRLYKFNTPILKQNRTRIDEVVHLFRGGAAVLVEK